MTGGACATVTGTAAQKVTATETCSPTAGTSPWPSCSTVCGTWTAPARNLAAATATDEWRRQFLQLHQA